VWIGDDAAVLGTTQGRLVLTTDLAVAGVHADLEVIGLDDLGWRAFAAAVSDVAAMGARPLGAVVGVAGPSSTDLDLLYDGIAASSEAHGCPVVGGDLSNATELVVAVTVAGQVEGEPGPVLRSGARPGDSLYVTGALGAAAAGLRALQARSGHLGTPSDIGAPPGSGSGSRGGDSRDGVAGAGAAGAGAGANEVAGEVDAEMAHRRPRARLAEGETARLARATAMIDISDGLLADLGHVADASGVGFRLDEVPVSPGATIDDALGGGEDYELVVAVADAEHLLAAFAAAGLRPPILIGACTADPAERTLAGTPVPALGWQHSWG
jgi:thiamine-monophosphate kinase